MSSKKHQKQIQSQLIELVNNRANENKCGECGATYPTWASVNIGIFLCGRCASVHKKVLSPPSEYVSKIKSLTLDTWSSDQIGSLQKIGNKRAKKKWNPKRIPFPYDGDDDPYAVEQYIRNKYVLGMFRDDGVQSSDFDDKHSRYSDESDSGRNGVFSRSRSNSYLTGAPTGRSRSNSYLSNGGSARSRSGSYVKKADVPLLSHRKLTTFENTLFQGQVAKILGYGYNNRDAVLESLLLSNGVIDLALDILEQDAKVNPQQSEIPPELPRRPAAAASSLPSSQPQSQGQQQDDWWATGSQASLPSTAGSIGQQPQIYQFTDPITGQVSYVDSNGQQYLDPNNPQHQQQLMQQTNPQLMAQQTNKQNILSLYNQPQFTSNAGQQQQLQQQQLQQQQLQQQQLQQQQQQQQMMQGGFSQAQYSQPQQTGQSQVSLQGQQFQPQFTGFGNPQQTGYNSFNGQYR